MKATEDDSIQIIPRNTPKVYRYDYWPLELARERLLDLEAHTERRYLLPPLNCESRLDVVQAQTSVTAPLEVEPLESCGGSGRRSEGTSEYALRESGSVCNESTAHEEVTVPLQQMQSSLLHIRRRVMRREDRETEGEETDIRGGAADGTSGEAQGLLLWRRSTRKADSVLELKRCAMQFEAAIAWDKSIMKVVRELNCKATPLPD